MDEYLASLLIREGNTQEVLRMLQDSLLSENDSISITYQLSDGTKQIYTIPSMSSLTARIKNLEQNIHELTNLDNLSSATILLPDGTIKPIFTSEQMVEPKDFSVQPFSSYFEEENAFKHLLSSPFVFAKIEVPRKQYPSYDKARLNKVVFSIKTAEDVTTFNTVFKGAKTKYDELIVQAGKLGIGYSENIMSVQITSSKFTSKGTFDVVSIVKKVDVINGTEAADSTVVYGLTTLTYTKGSTEVFLKVGDNLYVGTNTTYVINFVDRTKKYIGVKLIKGYEVITTGVGVFTFLGDIEEPYIQAPLIKGEYCVIFVKPVNSTLQIESNDWGVGYGYHSDEILNNKEVMNMWQSVKALSSENIIPSQEFVAPDKPRLDQNNFDVVVVNQHKSNADSVDTIKNKFSEKNKIESELTLSQDEHKTILGKMALLKPDDIATKKSLESALSVVADTVATKSQELTSKVNELSSISAQLQNFQPKYEVQGFVNIPVGKVIGGKLQDIIGIEVEYRYLSLDGKVKENQSFDLQVGDTSKKAIIPKWNKMPIPKLKTKTVDGLWVEDNLGDVDQHSINQVSIPISQNEMVEIRARSISEVGYPFQYNYSSWSDTLRVVFPDTLISGTNNIVDQTKVDLMYQNIYQRLVNLGIIKHNQDSTTVIDKYFAHFLRTIGTDSVTPEGKPIDAQTMFNDITKRMLNVESIVGSTAGVLRVRLLNEDQSQISEISQNGTVKFQDEYYKTLVENNTIKKGSIINKVFYVEITNTSDGDIELYPFVTGVSEDKIIQNYLGYTYNSNEYNQFRKYYKAPMSRADVVEDADFLSSKSGLHPFVEISAFQSSQVKSQGVYSRATDVTLNEDLWVDQNNGSVTPVFATSNPQTFVWDGSQTISTVAGGGGLTDFCVHVDHPLLKVTSDFMQNYSLYYSTGAVKTLPKQSYDATKAYYPPFIQTVLASDDKTYKQLAYREYTTANSLADINNFPNKTAFSENDKFLIGKNTCGLYLSLMSSQDLFLNEKFVNKGKVIKKGDRTVIPILASSRLTDYFGIGSTGFGNIGGVALATNVAYTKKIGVDVLVKESKLELPKLLSFDFQYTIQYEKASIN